MIKHIDSLCETWGAQRRYIDFGVDQGFRGETTVETAIRFRLSDRAPAWFRKRQFSAKGMQDCVIRPTQFSEEGHTGDGLVVAKALHGAPEDLRKLSYARYVIMLTEVEGSIHQYKADQLGISLSDYWRLLDRLHYFIAGRLPPSDDGYLTVSTGRPQIRHIPARIAEVSPAKPQLDLAALQRQRLRVYR